MSSPSVPAVGIPTAPTGNRKLTAVAIIAILAVVVGIYWNSLDAPFLFDDLPMIENVASQQQLPDLGEVFGSMRGFGNWTFALNHRLHGIDVFGYHATNIAIHGISAMLLFGLIRQTLISDRLRNTYGEHATGLAFIAASIWASHPLQTQAVTYTVQRYESLFSLFCFATLYCFLLATQASARVSVGWFAMSIACLALGLRSKEVMITAPLLVLWFDRVFVAKSWTEQFKRRGIYYAAVMIVVSLLALPQLLSVASSLAGQIFGTITSGEVASTAEPAAEQTSDAPLRPINWSDEHGNALVVKGLTPIEYARSQPQVIFWYLRLAFVPYPQTLDYAWPKAETTSEWLSWTIAMTVLLLLVVWCVFKRPAVGFLAGAFFLILSPSSSIIPINDLAFEHRMYLPLACLVVGVVLAGYKALRWISERLTVRDPRLNSQGAVRATRTSAERPNGVEMVSNASRPMSSVVLTGGLCAGLAVVMIFAMLTVLRNDDYSSEVRMWSDVVTKSPRNARAFCNLGLAFTEEGDYAAAFAAYHEALRLEPGVQYFYYNVGNTYIATGDNERAAAAYMAALKLGPGPAKLWNNLGLARMEQGNLTAARQHFTQALKIQPNYVGAIANLGLLAAREGRRPEAIEYYQRALALQPHHPETHNNLALALAADQKWNAAIEHWQISLEAKPSYLGARRLLAAAYLQQGRKEEALAQHRIVIAATPRDAKAHLKYAVCLAANSQYQMAEQEFRLVEGLDAKQEHLHRNWGELAATLQQYDRAVELYRQAILVDPQDALAYVRLGDALTQLSKLDDAIESYRNALTIDAAVPDAHRRLAESAANSGDLSKALLHYRAAAQQDNQDALLPVNIGLILERQQLPAEAVQAYQAALQIDPKLVSAHLNLAGCLAGQGKLAAAIEHYSHVVRLEPAHFTAYHNLANALARQNKLDEAIGCYRRALSIKPDFRPAQENLQQVLQLRKSQQVKTKS